MESDKSSEFQQNERYRYIIENTKDVIWELDKDFVFTFVSPTIESMAGYKLKEIVGRKLTNFLTETSKKYFLEQVNLSLNNTIKSELVPNALHDVQFICKNGFVKWVQVSAKRICRDGEFIGFIGTTRDIMEKKEYEYQLNQYIQELKKIMLSLKNRQRSIN